MPATTLESHHKLSGQLSADAVDTAHGIIRGATVAKSGVQATGKYVWLDAKGVITNDPEEMASEVPVFTDETTLSTLMTAAAAKGDQIKVREDHVAEVGTRVGYADEFKLTEDGRVTADIHIFKNAKHRDVTLETAQETPQLIGLSIDFTPTFEIRDGKALMRVSELHAVDIVDEGAITAGGLFLSASVDTGRKVESPQILPTATMAAPTLEELQTSIATLTKTVGELQTKLSATPAVVVPAVAPVPDANAVAALAAVNELKTQFATQKQEIVQMKREKALLGFRGTSEERAKLATAQPEEIEKATTEKKDYLALVAERITSTKCSRMVAHDFVRANHRDEYNAHREKGFVRAPATATAA